MKEISNRFLLQTLRYGFCLTFISLAGIAPAFAQEQEEEDEQAVVVYKKRAAEAAKEAEKYVKKSVRGTIYDNATRRPVSGAIIRALGYPNFSVLTNEDGTYSIDIPDFVNTLVITAPDFQSTQLAVKGSDHQDASILSSSLRGFYNDETNITSSKKAVLNESSSVSIETDMELQLAGDVRSVSRGGLLGMGDYLSIRGVNSINANAQPLIILDGNIIDPEYERTSLHEGYFNNILAGIDPDNVESIEVLKNGTALYGAKGANGVIVIKTKRGKSMATKINVRLYGGMEFAPKKLSMLDGSQYRSYLGDLTSTINDVTINNTNNIGDAFLNDSPNYYYNVFHNNTDWQKDMYRNTFVQNYKINVEGGDEIGMYNLALGFTQGKGTQVGNDMNRLNIRFNTDIKISEKISTELDISYNQNAYHIMDSGWSENYEMQNIGSTNVLGLIQSPMLSPYAWYMDEFNNNQLSLSKEYAGKYASKDNTRWIENPFKFPRSLGINESLRNPYWVLENGQGKNKNYAELTQISINAAPKYQITKQLSIKDRFHYQMNRNNEKYYLPIAGTTKYTLTDLGDITSVLKSQFTKETTLNNDLTLEWKNTYGAHKVSAMGGWRYNNYSYSYSFMRGYNNENDKLPNYSKDMAYPNYGGTKDNWIDMTYYLDAAYNYANRYYAQLTMSSQASSKFGSNTNDGFQCCGVSWGIFPSLQLGWVISNEDWFKTSKGINYLKLTAGAEQNGNDDLDYYAARTYWESQQVTENTVGLYLKNIENSSIQWETTTKFNIALEGSFLNNRLHAGLDLFWHYTDNMLTVKDLNYISGMKKYWTNDGAMRNTGFEFNANAALVNTKDWKWEVGATLGHYNNKITQLPLQNMFEMKSYNAEFNTYVHEGFINGYTSGIYGESNVLTAVGYAAGSFYGWQTNGVFQDATSAAQATTTNITLLDANGNIAYSNEGHLAYPTGLADPSQKFRNFQAGDVCFIDQNGDGVIDDNDKVVIGNPNPDIYGNLYTSLSWKNLRLDANFKYSLGNDIYNYQRSILEGGNTTYNQTSAMQNRWTHEGQQTNIPKACYMDSKDWRNNERMSDRWIEDGSFLKLKNLRLTYNLPYNNEWLQGLKVWAEGNNLFTITKYLGTDPEMSSRNSVLYQGIDTGINPSGRSFNIGVSLNL